MHNVCLGLAILDEFIATSALRCRNGDVSQWVSLVPDRESAGGAVCVILAVL